MPRKRTVLKSNNNRFVGARIPPFDFRRAEKLVEAGHYTNISDLMRRALTEKLDREDPSLFISKEQEATKP